MNVALVGNQNSGKTTLFNALTGSNQKIGNWPGVTIERKEGTLLKTDDITIVDLPGIYSLSPYTSEEEISRNYLLEEKPEVVVNIVDATSIERSLYLTTQLMELDCQVIMALNMADLLVKKGLTINEEKLAKELGVKVVTISALKNTGIDKLIDEIKGVDVTKKTTKKEIFPKEIEKEIDVIGNLLNKDNARFIAVKNLEDDELLKNQEISENVLKSREKIEKHFKTDIEQIIANERYNFIVSIRDKVLTKIEIKETVTDKLDKVFLNKWAAIPIFAVIMFAVYYLSVGVIGMSTVDLIDGWFSSLGEWVSEGLTNLGASDWAVSLVVDGVIAGIGAVLNFVPQLIILFLCISILETSGYMSRISFMFDKIFRKFGLSGKSLIPFIVGSGCSVPAIMTCRTIEDEQEKQMTIMLTPFVPCSAKLPIIALFAGAFFPNNSGLISASLYFFAIVIIIISAILMRKFVYKAKTTTFISELPEYKLPSPKYVVRDVFDKSWSFIKRAGTVILFCSLIVWFLGSFSWTFEYGVAVEDSMLAGIGSAFSWIFYPILGELNWAASVSAIQGLVAKEQVVSSMTVIAGLAEGAENMIFTTSIFSGFTGLSAYAYMVFNLFSAPCFGAIGAMKREFGSTKKTVIAVLFQTGIAWVLSSLVFGIGSLIGLIF